MTKGNVKNHAVLSAFKDRLADDLLENNVLRGAWVEQIVHHYLVGWDFSRPWDYFDLIRPDEASPDGGRTLSIKHSTGAKAKYEIKRKQFAWDTRLASAGKYEGWRGHEARPAQHWCDVYLFASLPGDADLPRVLEPSEWRFHVLSRGDMCTKLPNPEGRTISETALTAIFGVPIAGHDLQARVDGAIARRRMKGEPKFDRRPLELGP